jgi:pimeloyl-ACP methyl ester carboxylesterase
MNTAIRDLHHLLENKCRKSFGTDVTKMRLVLVCNALGCALARLYAAAYPGRIEGFLFLDSAIANSELMSAFPDPDSPGFDTSKLAPGVTVDNIRHARAVSQKYFHSTSPTKRNWISGTCHSCCRMQTSLLCLVVRTVHRHF